MGTLTVDSVEANLKKLDRIGVYIMAGKMAHSELIVASGLDGWFRGARLFRRNVVTPLVCLPAQ